jgi:hypothetical protein
VGGGPREEISYVPEQQPENTMRTIKYLMPFTTFAVANIVACSGAEPGPKATTTTSTESISSFLSTPHTTSIRYVLDEQDTWTGVTLLSDEGVTIPVQFTFAAPSISREQLARFKSHATTLDVSFDPTRLTFERASSHPANPEKRFELANAQEIGAALHGGSSLPTLCGDQIVRSSHGSATIDGQVADYTIQIQQPVPSDAVSDGDLTLQGIASGNTPGCLWISNREAGATYLCPSGQVCPTTWPCTILTWTWVQTAACASGTAGGGSPPSGSGSACGHYTSASISQPVPVTGACTYNGGIIYDTCDCDLSGANAQAAVDACAAAQARNMNPPQPPSCPICPPDAGHG